MKYPFPTAPVAHSGRDRPLLRFTLMALLSALAGAAQAQSLYSEASFRPLTGDRRAARVGDSLTVLIHENASAISTTDTATGHNNGVNATLESPFHSHFIVGTHTGSLHTGTDFDGTGKTERQGQLVAQITLTVREVLPNGMLAVSGEQSLEINNEKQLIKVEGRARPEDVSEANEILSYRLSDARISYQGEGDLASSQRPSWWSRLLSAFGV